MKVLVGNDVSFRFPKIGQCTVTHVNDCEDRVPLGVYEKDIFLDVDTIKNSPDTHFSILTLKESVEFSENLHPLCLPEIDGRQKDAFKGTVLGFGYNQDFQEYLVRIAKKGILKERQMKRAKLNVISSTKFRDTIIQGIQVPNLVPNDGVYLLYRYKDWSFPAKQYKHRPKKELFWFLRYATKLSVCHSVPECGFEVLKTYQAPAHIWDLPG